MKEQYLIQLKLSEEELEKIQAFLDSVHEALNIPLVLREDNPEYPISLAENHYGISPDEKEKLRDFIQTRYKLESKHVPLKTLVSSHDELSHVGLPRAFIARLA